MSKHRWVTLMATVVLGVALTTLALVPATARPARNAHSSSTSWSGYPQTKDTSGWELESPNGVFTMVFQTDNNWVLYRGGTHAVWATHTSGQKTYTYLQMNPSGEIDIGTYRNPGVAYFCDWDNRIFTSKAYSWTLTLSDTGDLRETRSDGVLYWHTDGGLGSSGPSCEKG